MSDQSYTDAEASKLIITIFSMVTIIADIIIFYMIHYVSRQIPQPNQYDHNNQKKTWLFGRIYPSFYFVDTAKIHNSDDSDDDEKEQEIKALIENHDSYFGEHEISIWSKLFRHRTINEYFILLLQFWSLCCGIIAFYLSLVFYMNMIIEYIISCMANGWSYSLIALLALFFIIENIFWGIRRQIESVQLICRNAMDIYDIRFITLWRLFNLFCCIAFSVWVAFDDNFIPFSDILWWQFFLFFMVIRGIIFQLLYGIIVFIESAIMIFHKLKICYGGNHKINILQLIFVIDLKNNNRDRDMFECPKWIQYAFIIVVFCYVAVSIFLYGLNDDELFRFAAGSGILYYIIMLFERGKYNALYMLWTLRFHEEYYDCFVVFEESKIVNLSNENTMLSMELSEKPDNKKNSKRKIHHKQNTHGTMLIKNDSDLPLIEAVQYDMHELMMYKIKYIQFWNNIKYDYKRNDYWGCNKYCHCAQDWFGWFCIVIFIIAIILTAYLYLIQSNKTTKEIFETENGMKSSYPICDFKLRENNYLSIMDLTFLSIVAYHGSSSQIDQQFSLWFGANYTASWDLDTLSTHENPSFFHIYNKQFDFDVIAIRGTVDKSDTEQDIGLWTEVTTFQIFSWLIPLTDVLPMGFIRQFINIASIPEKMITPSVRDNYDNPVYDYIKNNVIGVHNNDTYIMTIGHSLGGAISQIVGARLYDDGYGNNNDNIISFGVSNPGVLYSSKKFGFSARSLDKTAVSLLPRRDIVPMVDFHGGVVQMIECNAKQVFNCHSSQTTFCEMYEQCSNELIRNITFMNCVCIEKNDWAKCW